MTTQRNCGPPHSRRRSLPSLATGGTALAQKKYDTGATDTEIKIGNIMPYTGPASAYGVIGKTEEAYFKMINDKGGINGRKINFISYDDAYSAAEGGRAGAQAGRERRGAGGVQPARHAVQHRDPEISERQEGAAAVRRHRRHQVERPEDFPWTMGWQPSYQSEARIYAKFLLEGKAGRQDRDPVPERRFRQRLPQGPEGRPRRQGFPDHRRGKLRDRGADDRRPHRQAQVHRRRRLHQHHDAEIRGAGHQEDGRDRAGSRCRS